jgi:hypothetical protein
MPTSCRIETISFNGSPNQIVARFDDFENFSPALIPELNKYCIRSIADQTGMYDCVVVYTRSASPDIPETPHHQELIRKGQNSIVEETKWNTSIRLSPGDKLKIYDNYLLFATSVAIFEFHERQPSVASTI